MFFLSCLRVGVYTVLAAGWSSNSMYALLGGLRAVAQTISYEVRLVLALISLIFLIRNYCFFRVIDFQGFFWFIIFIFPIFFIWFVSLLAETNRTPFDFAEGESELVSGFNVEYRRGGFALIFGRICKNFIYKCIIIFIFFRGECV